MSLRVLYACSEVFPLLKTGGLADVSAGLPPALAAQGADVRLLLPAFPSIMAGVTPEGPSLLVPAAQIWRERGQLFRYLDRRFDHPQERLLRGLELRAHALEVGLDEARLVEVDDRRGAARERLVEEVQVERREHELAQDRFERVVGGGAGALGVGLASEAVGLGPLAIGPEGGWSPRDRDTLSAAGFTGLRLGPRILRTETAGLAAIAALQSRFGDL